MDHRYRSVSGSAGARTAAGAASDGSPAGRVRHPAHVEWPTLLVAAGVYLPIVAALAAVGSGACPWWSVTPALAWCVAWQASLQHEVIHGHPTPWGWANRLVAGPPLLLAIPFDRYRDSHLAHHVDERLTDPLDDPESWYVTAEAWRSACGIERGFRLAMNTLAGRVVLGPLWVLGLSILADMRDLASARRIGLLAWHGFQVCAVSVGLGAVGMPIWGYLILVVWPATGLLLIRSYAEHRPSPNPAERSVIVEAAGLFDLLFLSNNLHALHHERPGLPWYVLRHAYRDGRDRILARNGGYWFASYPKMVSRYFFSLLDHPIHPSER